MELWTVYFNPSDWPGKYVVRKHIVPTGPTNVFFVTDTLEGIRACIPLGLIKFNRDQSDDKCIIESWL